MFKNPIEAFVDWYKSIPPDHQEVIASNMAIYFPGLDCEPVPGSYAREEFLRYVLQQQSTPMKAIGTSIALDRIIGFSVMNIYDRKDLVSYQAENLKKFHQRVLEDLGEAAAEPIEKMRNEHRFKSALWLNTAASWKTFRIEYFTEESYENTMRGG